MRPFPVTSDTDPDREKRKELRDLLRGLESEEDRETKEALLQAMNPYAGRGAKPSPPEIIKEGESLERTPHC